MFNHVCHICGAYDLTRYTDRQLKNALELNLAYTCDLNAMWDGNITIGERRETLLAEKERRNTCSVKSSN